jgi:rhamnogalacturonyl hydrolase YesR
MSISRVERSVAGNPLQTFGRRLGAGLLVILAISTAKAQESPIALARGIAARIMRETPLQLRLVPQKPLPDLHVLDFRLVFGEGSSGVAYASSTIRCAGDTVLRFGVSTDSPLRVFVRGARVFETDGKRGFRFREVGYDLYEFTDTMTVALRRGENPILVKAVLSSGRNVVVLRELFPPGTITAARFETPIGSTPPGGTPWLFTGTYSGGVDPLETPCPPESGFLPWYTTGGDIRGWRSAPQTYVSALVIDSSAAYARESYAEWMYPSGTVLLALLQLSRATGDTAYEHFVRRVCNFTTSNLPLFRHQYFHQLAFRGTHYRIFRRSMLDDTGAPVLPYVELRSRGSSPTLDSLITWMAEWVTSGQDRLPDGTLCRQEHRPYTVWGDDLFMSVPFLLRLAGQTGEGKYYDDAAGQILNFHRYLTDPATSLCRHAYYAFSDRRSPVLWGRANGWIVWAHTEALLRLPKNHPSYAEVTKLFRRHMKALVRVQGREGLWHQILDDDGSFEETSCTAMFMIGMARGMSLGVLGSEYEAPLRKALNGLRSRISDGIVRDITRGTEVSDDPGYYRARERYPNDPRGLGAVITALIEAEAVLGGAEQ